MSLLQNALVETKRAWLSYPGIPGFEVELATISRPALVSLRKRCMISKFDRKLRQPVETLDEDLFVAEFTKATIKNWKGLTLSKLETLIPLDITEANADTEIHFNLEDAQILVKNSPDFDIWINDAVFDLENFRTRNEGRDMEPAGEVAE